MLRTSAGVFALAVIPNFAATEATAGINQDLKSCTASSGRASAAACTRVMRSGRLPKKQRYIAYFNRGWSYFNAGDIEKALKDFNRSASHAPNYADTYYSRAVVRHERGDRDETVSDLARYLKLKKDRQTARLNRATLFRHRDEAGRGLTELEQVTFTGKKKTQAMTLRALLLSDIGEHDEALKLTQDALSLKPESNKARYARALVSFRKNDLTTAKEDCDTLISNKKMSASTHVLLGRIAEKEGDKERARHHYKSASIVKPRSVPTRSAVKEAKTLLIKLEKKKDEAANASTLTVAKSDKNLCSRYIPATSTTIAVPCTEQ